MRVFGSPAQIFVRATIRQDKKLSDRSVSGTFVGISDKGNGYIFLIQKSDELVDIDSKDAKFNETFSDYRERQGKLTKAPYILPDLTEEIETRAIETSNYGDEHEDSDADGDERQEIARQQRVTTPRKFLLPGTGTHSNVRVSDYSKEKLAIRKQQYSNLCLDNLMDNNKDSILILDCMEAKSMRGIS
jgi:hypothetical protein